MINRIDKKNRACKFKDCDYEFKDWEEYRQHLNSIHREEIIEDYAEFWMDEWINQEMMDTKGFYSKDENDEDE